MGKDVIIACDFSSAEEVFAFLSAFGDRRPFVKIGMELFYACGPDIVRRLKAEGYKIFLDVKVHDIPNTIKRTMTVLSSLGADVVNLHAAGGSTMMCAAAEGLEEGFRGSSENLDDKSKGGAPRGEKPLLIAVTQLTSTDEAMLRDELLIDRPMKEVVMSYAMNAKACGLDGVVCSPHEASEVHEVCGDGFVTVTPGVRFADSEKGDQKRVMTPEMARLAGSDYIVVGRPITQAKDPVAAYERCIVEFTGRQL